MSKFHINAKGIPAPCKAKAGNCPFGGADSHYDSMNQAQEAADKNNEANHGFLPKVKTLPPTAERQRMRFKEIKLMLKDGTEVTGECAGSEENNVSIRVDGDYRYIKKIDTDDIVNMESLSSDSVYNRSYREKLRSENKARPEFRFNKDNLEDYKGKFVKVQYDGKDFDGEVIDTHYGGINNNGFIIQNEDGTVKHIKDYRLNELEQTGDNLKEHKQTVRLKALENEIVDNVMMNYDSEPEYSDITDFQSPTEEINKYFRAVMENKKGGNVDLNKIDFNWTEDVEESKDGGAYDDASRYWHDLDKGGGQWAEWSDASQEAYDDDLSKAYKMDEFYGDRKEAINDTVKAVEKIDWTPYYDTQEEGEIEALEYLNDIGMFTDV